MPFDFGYVYRHYFSGGQVPYQPPIVNPAPPPHVQHVHWAPPAAPAMPAARHAGPDEFQRTFSSDEPVDFAAGSLRAIRYWSVWTPKQPDATPPFLHGVKSPWLPKNPVHRARCLADRDMVTWTTFNGTVGQIIREGGMHQVPDEGCTCGFYAYWVYGDDDGNIVGGSRDITVCGVIEGFGRVLVGERGMRCEKARILGLAIESLPSPVDGAVFSMWMDDKFNSLDAAMAAAYLQMDAIAREAVTLVETIGRRYQVPVYGSVEELLKAHPPSTVQERS